MGTAEIRPGYELWRPNREKAESKMMKALVILLLLVSAGVSLVIVLGGWSRLQGGGIIPLIFIGLYVLFAFRVAQWSRGVLPVAASIAILLTIFMGLASAGWFARAKDGLDQPTLPEELLGLLCAAAAILQVLLIAVTMIAFNQEWHVEEERPIGGGPPGAEPGDESPPPPSDRDEAAPYTSSPGVSHPTPGAPA
jgi:lysylphosphatidylglycerol synthetase-like protein (DUF2156 family)